MSIEEIKEKRTRNRVPVTCAPCRVKKLKCDKGRPSCGRCTKLHITDLCVYEQQPWKKKIKSSKYSNNDSTMTKTDSGTLGDNNMKQESHERDILPSPWSISPASGPSVFNGSPTALASMPKNSKPTETKIQTVVKYNNICPFMFKNNQLLTYGGSSYLYYANNDKYICGFFDKYRATFTHRYDTISECLENTEAHNFKPKTDHQDCTPNSLIQPVTTPEFPPLDIILSLSHRFFRFCYVFAPFIEEKKFMKEIVEVFTMKDPIDKQVCGAKRLFIAILCIILRFSYLTVPHNKYASATLEDVDIISDPSYLLWKKLQDCNVKIGYDFVDFAKFLILSPSLLLAIDFRKLQSVLLLKVYLLHCPEFDERSANPNTLSGLFVQLSKFLGINQDPTSITILSLSPEGVHLWRKLWAYLLFIDAHLTFDNGSLLLIIESSIKCQEPFKDLDSTSLWLSGRELKLARGFRLKSYATTLFRRGSLALNSEETTLEELEEILNHLDILLYEKLNSFEDLFNSKMEPEELSFIVDEILLRSTLLATKVVVKFYTYLNAPYSESEKEKLLGEVIELTLILLKLGYEFALNAAKMMPAEYETLAAPFIWNSMKSSIYFLSGIMIKSLKENLSILKLLTYAKLNEGKEAIEWADLQFKNDIEIYQQLVDTYSRLYELMMKLSSKFFHSFYLCVTLKYIVDYFKDTFSQILNDAKQQNQLETPPEMLRKFWDTLEGEFEFSDYLKELQFNIDPYLN